MGGLGENTGKGERELLLPEDWDIEPLAFG